MTSKIILKGDPLYKEAKAGEAGITPGMLLELDAAGDVVSHINAGQDQTRKYAIENRDIGEGIDDNYADNDEVHYVVARPGDEIYALLSAGNDAAIGAELESDGAGALQLHTPVSIVESGTATKSVYTTAIAAVAIEAVDNDPGTGGAAVRIRVEVV